LQKLYAVVSMKLFGKKEIGDYGEELAKKYLKEKNLKFVKSNYQFYKKEIDLIFCDRKNRIIIFVEVKTRSSKDFGEPENAINYFKQKNVRQAATGFLKNYPEYDEYDIRFDSVSVYIGSDNPEINHTENAF
jgi:putative endonuclease